VKATRAASAALAALLLGPVLLGTAGCTLFAEQGTLVQYQPSDGAAATVGDIRFLNIIGLSEDGEDVALLLTIVNTGADAETVNFQYEDADGEKQVIAFSVPGNTSTSFGSGDQESVVLRDVAAQVGGSVPLYIQFGSEQGQLVQVPVLTGANPEYSDGLPSPVPTPTETPTPEPSETPAS
jgi:hypothetical protein